MSTFKLLAACVALLFCSLSLKAQNLTFKYVIDNGAPSTDGYTPCTMPVKVAWTTTVGGMITAHGLSHTFNPNDTYVFSLGSGLTPVGNITYLFTAPCVSVSYGQYPKATIDAGLYGQISNGYELYFDTHSSNSYSFGCAPSL